MAEVDEGPLMRHVKYVIDDGRHVVQGDFVKTIVHKEEKINFTFVYRFGLILLFG